MIEELTALKVASEVSSEQVLVWSQRVEAQGSKIAVMENIRDAKDIDSEGRDRSDQK